MRFPCLLHVKHYTMDLCYKRVVVQINNKCSFQKHTVAQWRRKTWKANGLNLKPHPFFVVLSRRHWVPSCLWWGGPASSPLLSSAAAAPAAFLLHYPDVGIVDSFSLSVRFEGYFSVSKGKGLSPPSVSKYSLHSKYSVV